MAIEGAASDELNPLIVCIVCNDSEVQLQHKFGPLLHGLACEPDMSEFLAAREISGDLFDPEAWLQSAQEFNGNVVGRLPDAPIAVEGVPNA